MLPIWNILRGDHKRFFIIVLFSLLAIFAITAVVLGKMSDSKNKELQSQIEKKDKAIAVMLESIDVLDREYQVQKKLNDQYIQLQKDQNDKILELEKEHFVYQEALKDALSKEDWSKQDLPQSIQKHLKGKKP